jgi:YHS domain-containing protein
MILRPDAFVDIEFLVEFPPAITVPVEAVLDSGLKKTVFIDLGNGFFEPRKVKTGWRFGERVEITGGLMSGEKIVTSANFLIDSESRMKLAAAGAQESVAVIDPVCGMDVNENKAKTAGMKSEYNGAPYYFCSDECKHIFNKVPERFVKAVAQTEPPQQEHAIRQEQMAMSAKPVEHSSHIAPKPIASGTVLNDPVCGMKLDEGKAEASGVKSEHNGTTYYFCSNACKQRFDKEPERFTQKAPVEQLSHHSASTFKPEHTDMMGHADMIGEDK